MCDQQIDRRIEIDRDQWFKAVFDFIEAMGFSPNEVSDFYTDGPGAVLTVRRRDQDGKPIRKPAPPNHVDFETEQVEVYARKAER